MQRYRMESNVTTTPTPTPIPTPTTTTTTTPTTQIQSTTTTWCTIHAPTLRVRRRAIDKLCNDIEWRVT